MLHHHQPRNRKILPLHIRNPKPHRNSLAINLIMVTYLELMRKIHLGVTSCRIKIQGTITRIKAFQYRSRAALIIESTRRATYLIKITSTETKIITISIKPMLLALFPNLSNLDNLRTSLSKARKPN